MSDESPQLLYLKKTATFVKKDPFKWLASLFKPVTYFDSNLTETPTQTICAVPFITDGDAPGEQIKMSQVSVLNYRADYPQLKLVFLGETYLTGPLRILKYSYIRSTKI